MGTARAKKKEPASTAVQREWLRRVEAEYRSAAIAQHLTLWLMQIGASPDLVRAGLKIVSDEMTHAELSHRTFVAAGGEGGPSIVRESLELVRHISEPLEHDVLRVGVDVFCLGETVAVPLFKELRQRCVVPMARQVLDRVLRDEVRHRDFGWMLLGWLLELPMAATLRPIIDRELPGYFHRVRTAYTQSVVQTRQTMDDGDSAWGLMPAAQYAATVSRALTRDWIPRFGKLGIDAQKAWDAAQA